MASSCGSARIVDLAKLRSNGVNWIIRSSIRNLTRAIRSAGERGDLATIDELKKELDVLGKVWENAMEEAVMRSEAGSKEGKG